MRPAEILALFPERLHASHRQPELVYLKRNGCAVHNRPPDAPAPGAVLLLNDGEIAVYPGEPPPSEMERKSCILTAIYAQEPSGALAVPTGFVFIRFPEGVAVDDRRDQIAQAGYEIRERLAYARHACWLRASSGNPADALQGIPRLEKLPDIENVEPQILLERAQRI